MTIKKLLKKNYDQIIAALIGIFFGSLLMFSTFSEKNNILLISSKAWSDFASHIPLIRSFSLGNNFPPQYPLFPGENIKYHFLFYSLVGIFEKMGVRIDIALNLLSVLGFTLLVILIFAISKEIFKSKSIGFVSIMFFLFNSSLSFIYFFKDHKLSLENINQIISNNNFLSFAPYGSGIISAFWNLNIYTNQRHLALSFALSLGIVYLLIKKVNGTLKIKKEKLLFFLIGVALGFSFFFHIAVFVMTVAVVFSLGLFFKEIRIYSLLILIPASLIAFPQYKFLTSSEGYGIHLVFGYLTSANFSIFKFIEFWIYNLGLSIFLIPFGFIIANKFQKKIILSFFALFAIGNIFQFSPEMAANHKFFNYFIIIGNIYSACAIFYLWNKKNYLIKLITIFFAFFMIFGGIIDIFPILNDQKIQISDYKLDERSLWIEKNTNPNSVFLNTSFLYDPASLVGRKIYLGWPYFAWSQGYDTDKRFTEMKKMLEGNDKLKICRLLIKNNIDYVEIQNPQDSNIPTPSAIFKKSFYTSYENMFYNYSIYNVNKSCK